MKILKEVWEYRNMIGNLVKKDLTGRYKGSVLGFLWTLINPLFQLIIYSVLFSIILPNRVDNYAIFLFVALVPWLFCSTSVLIGSECIMQNSGLVQKIYFPRIVLPIITVTSNFINMLLTFIIVFAALFITGVGISVTALLLPLVMIVEYLFVLGLVLLFSSLTVYFRDLSYILGIVMMGWMYLTPVLYPIDQVQGALLQGFMNVNPMAGIVGSYRDILFYKTLPNFGQLGIIALASIVIIVIGFVVFQKLQKRFAEEL